MILGIIQARISSTRLPGKALMTIQGIPMLLMVIDRARKSKLIDELIVATSYEKEDTPIAKLCYDNLIYLFRGELENVLDRFFVAALEFGPDHVVRITGDCPLIDPEIIDKTIEHHIEGEYDYTRNYGFPDGLDVEVMKFETLKAAWMGADSEYDREHVTSYIYNHPELFKLGSYENNIDLSYVKLSVDTPEDFEKISRIIEVCRNSTISEILKDY